MKMSVLGVAALASLALAVPATAAPGQCSMTGFDDFACDVSADGGGITFALPDGTTFVFAHVGDGEGLGYRVSADSRPGERPEELGMFRSLANKDGCWVGEADELQFCVALEQ